MFYRFERDLWDATVPFFRAGLESGEQCLWVAADPAAALSALRREVEDLSTYERRGQIEVLHHSDLYGAAPSIDPGALLEGLIDRERRARQAGFQGLRASGDASWLDRRSWPSFLEYEAAVNGTFEGQRVVALCSYTLERCSMDDVLDVAAHHDFVLIRDGGKWRSLRNLTLAPAAAGARRPRPARHTICFFDDAEASTRFGRTPAEESPGAAEEGGGPADLEHRRLLALETITTAVARAQSPKEIVDTVSDFCPLFRADDIKIEPEEAPQPQQPSASQWLTEPGEIIRLYPAFGSAAKALAVIPLVTSTRRLGRIFFKFEAPTRFDPEERSFLESAAQQLALALERAELQGADRERLSRDELIATLSHELRNPLASISAVSEAIKLLDDPSQRGYWQAVLDRQITHMDNLLNEMLDFSQSEQRAAGSQTTRVDVRAVLRDALVDKKVEIERRGLKLHAELDGEAAPHWVKGHRTSLTQVFHNVLGNSVKFTEAPGEIAVTCRPDPAGAAVVTISDTGSGIEESLLPHVFEPFTQAARHGTGSKGGLGLGLALVKRLVALHGGTVSIDSRGPGKGTTFTLVLPPAD